MMPILLQSTVDIRGSLANLSGGPKFQADLGIVIASFFGLVILIGGLLTFMNLILGGLNYVTAGGDKGKIEKAREKIIQSIIGLAILAAAFAIFAVVQYFFGINIVKIGGPGASTDIGNTTTTGGGSGGICTEGATANDGGAGGYCTGGAAATVKCTKTSTIQYLHWEPCGCSGSSAPKAGMKFIIGC
jgi:hypothetical protein